MIFNQTQTKSLTSQPEDFGGVVSLWHNDAEQGLLGALLLDPKALPLVEGLEEADFYPDAHRLIYRQIVAMVNQQIPVDVLTVLLTRVRGVDYVNRCVASAEMYQSPVRADAPPRYVTTELPAMSKQSSQTLPKPVGKKATPSPR